MKEFTIKQSDLITMFMGWRTYSADRHYNKPWYGRDTSNYNEKGRLAFERDAKSFLKATGISFKREDKAELLTRLVNAAMDR